MQCDARWDDLKTTDPFFRRYKESFTTEFPSEDLLKINFENPDEINNYLVKTALSIGYFQNPIYEKKLITKNNENFVVFNCLKRRCESVLEYRWRANLLTLSKFNNNHSHKLKLTPKKARIQAIRQYLLDLPNENQIQDHIQEVKSKFKLTFQQAKYIKTKLFWRFDNDDTLLEKLTERNVTFRRDVPNGILLVLSQSMKSNYYKYGDLVCFDITYKLLKKKKKQEKHLGVGFFVGQDENTRIVLFGMCTIAHETRENFKRLFQYFFECHDYRIPETMLTDDQRALVSALEELKVQNHYGYHHLLDWYHKIESIKKAINREHHKDVIYPLFCRILKQPSRQIYQDIIYEIAGFLNKASIMESFLKQQYKYCLSQVPCTFFGFGVSSTRAESMNNLIKKYVSHQTNLGKLVFCVLRVERKLLNNMSSINVTNTELLTHINDEQIRHLSTLTQHLAFDQIRKYYESSLEQTLKIVDSINAELPYVKYDRNYSFKMRYDIGRECWVCECRAIYKTGMPCSHLVKVIRLFGGCVGYYINERWFHSKVDPEKVKPSRPPIAKNRVRI